MGRPPFCVCIETTQIPLCPASPFCKFLEMERNGKGVVMTAPVKIGRPTKAPRRGERRVSLGLRVAADVKRRLDATAVKHGRSQSQEAERRLEQSFSLDAAHGGEGLRDVATLMAATFAHAGTLAARGKGADEWVHDPFVYREAIKA